MFLNTPWTGQTFLLTLVLGWSKSLSEFSHNELFWPTQYFSMFSPYFCLEDFPLSSLIDFYSFLRYDWNVAFLLKPFQTPSGQWLIPLSSPQGLVYSSVVTLSTYCNYHSVCHLSVWWASGAEVAFVSLPSSTDLDLSSVLDWKNKWMNKTFTSLLETCFSSSNCRFFCAAFLYPLPCHMFFCSTW